MNYAIINKDTNLVTNIVLSDSESNLFLNYDEYAVPARKSTQIGHFYDKSSGTFPEVVELDAQLEYLDEVNDLMSQVILPLPSHLSEENRETFIQYMNSLTELLGKNYSEGKLELQNLVKPDFDLLIPPTESETTI